MSWQRKTHHIIKAIGMHIFHMEEPVSGAQHKLQICIGHDSCPLCGHVMPKDNLGKIDPFDYERRELMALELSHANIDTYGKRTHTPIKSLVGRGAPLKRLGDGR